MLHPSEGLTTQAREVRRPDGSLIKVINIGVPRNHPFADHDRRAVPSDLYNLIVGPIRLPPAPTILIRIRGPDPNYVATREDLEN